MKKSKEYAAELPGVFSVTYNKQLLDIIKQAQIDAIEETAKACAKSARWENTNYGWGVPEGVEVVGDDTDGYFYINKQSILSVADKLKSEL